MIRKSPLLDPSSLLARSVVAASLLAALALPAGHAQLAPIAGSMAVGQLIEQLRQAANDVIAQTEGAVGRQSFEVRQHAFVLLQQLDSIAAGFRDTTFAQLNDTQRGAFNNLRAAVADLETGVGATAQHVRTTLELANDVVATVPGSNRRPRIRTYSPSYVVVGREPIRVAVDGAFLGFQDPTLTIGDTRCDRVAKIETRLDFLCPAGALRSASGVASHSARLVVYNYRTFWERLSSLFSDSRRAFDYQLAFYAVPSQVGTMEAVAHVKTITRETAARSNHFQHQNGHCQGEHPLNWTQNAVDNWRIDPTSIRTSIASENYASFDGIAAPTEGGFQVRARVRNHGTCVRDPIFGHIIAYDARGWIGVDVSWTEYRDVETTVVQLLSGQSLAWGRDLVFELPESTTGVAFELRALDGSIVAFDLTSASALHSNRWIEAQYEPATSRVVIRPRPIQAVLG